MLKFASVWWSWVSIELNLLIFFTNLSYNYDLSVEFLLRFQCNLVIMWWTLVEIDLSEFGASWHNFTEIELFLTIFNENWIRDWDLIDYVMNLIWNPSHIRSMDGGEGTLVGTSAWYPWNEILVPPLAANQSEMVSVRSRPKTLLGSS